MGALPKRALSKLVLGSARFVYLFAVGRTSPGFPAPIGLFAGFGFVRCRARGG